VVGLGLRAPLKVEHPRINSSDLKAADALCFKKYQGEVLIPRIIITNVFLVCYHDKYIFLTLL